MPKMRTHKGANKRIKITNGKTPKLLRRKKVRGKNVKASTSKLRQTRKMATVSRQDAKVIRKLIPGI